MSIEERYQVIKVVGEGSFGLVCKAIDRFTGEVVALKVMKQPCNPSDYLPEIHALTSLDDHVNIVSLKRVDHAEDTVFMAFEFMDGSLFDHIQQRMRCWGLPLSEAEVRSISYQVFDGLRYMHSKGFMHRDLKPANILFKRGVVKIADMGAATEIDSGELFSDYVTTRFYRAPEMLIRSFEKDLKLRRCLYDEKVDMWAMGAIMAELFLMFPLFRGESSADQLEKICQVIGAPTRELWLCGMVAAKLVNAPKLGPEKGVGFRAVMPHYASDSAIDLIESLCSWDPDKRPSAEEAMQHPFFTRVQNVSAPPGFSYCNRAMNNAVPKTELSTLHPIC